MTPANENIAPSVATILHALASLENIEIRQVLATAVSLSNQRCGAILTKRCIDTALISMPVLADRSWLSLDEIAERVGEHYGFTVREMRAPYSLENPRCRRIAQARQEAYWLARQQRWANGKQRYSFPMIGRYFGRDYSTVIYGVQAHQARLTVGAAA